MEKTRLKKILRKFFILYIVLSSAFFIFIMAVSYSWYFQDGEILKFCVHVPVTQYHHFAVSEHNACLIDWWPFIEEALVFPVAVYFVAVLTPYFLLRMGKRLQLKAANETGREKPWKKID